MLDKIPNAEEMTALVGQPLYDAWNKLCAFIDEKYEMECLWNKGGKAWTYEYKYRRNHYSKQVQKIYDAANTYHDGKWVMFEPIDPAMFPDFMKLLSIKRKPNRKA